MFNIGFLFAGEESVSIETMTKPALQPSNEKIQFVDRLAISITKRKRSTPQKFLGELFIFSEREKLNLQHTHIIFIFILLFFHSFIIFNLFFL